MKITNSLGSLGFMQSGSVYDENYLNLAQNRIIFLNENVTKQSAADITALLIKLDIESEDFITFYINTNGGDLTGLVQIYDTMQLIDSPVKTVCLSKAFSAGAVLLAAGEPGYRFIAKNARVMIHGLQCLFPMPGTDITGSKSYYEFLNKANDGMLKILAKHTGQELEQVKTDCERDSFLSAKEAVEYGLVDKII
jgi:ATP-dependent Clp protease protease subunit